MSATDQQLEFLKARVEALEKEVNKLNLELKQKQDYGNIQRAIFKN